MAKIVRFKDDNTLLNVSGIGSIDRNNITLDLYERIIKLSDGHAKYFTVTESEPEKPKATTKQNQNDF